MKNISNAVAAVACLAASLILAGCGQKVEADPKWGRHHRPM